MGSVATAAQLKERWRGFSDVDDATVESYIAAAELEVLEHWGDLRFEGVMQHAAGHLAADQFGAPMQLDDKTGDNFHLRRWRQLRRSVGMATPAYRTESS